MIFPRINADSLVQVNDGIRIDARKTIYKDPAQITDVLISPEDSDGAPEYISVYDGGDFDSWYIDWIYATAGEKTARVKVVLADASEKTIVMTIVVTTEAADLLFSKDSDILQAEPDVLRYLPEGKTSYTFMHREAQRRILAFLDEQRIWKKDNARFTKEDIVDMEEFVHWSRFLVLHLIFAAKIVSEGDVFTFKANEYDGLMKAARGRATLRLDTDGDEVVDTFLDRSATIQVRR